MTAFEKYAVAFWIAFMSFYVLLGFHNFFSNHWWTLLADIAAVIGGIANIRLTNYFVARRLSYR